MTFVPTYTYDPTSTVQPTAGISLVRLLVGDTDFSNTTTPPLSVMFADQEITLLLNNNQGDPVMTECACLLTIANDRARLSTFVELQGGGSVDMRAVAKELREQEKQIRERWWSTPAMAETERNWNNFSAREILFNYLERTQGS